MLLLASGLALLSVPHATAANAQSSTVLVRGRVVSTNDAAVAGAFVSAGAPDSLASVFAQTDAQGKYQLHVPRRWPAVRLSVRAAGHQSKFVSVSIGPSDSVVDVATVKLAEVIATLPAIRTVLPRPRASRDFTGTLPAPGEERNISNPSSDLSSILSGDLSGDLAVALTTIPGVDLVPDGRGSVTVSIAGLGAAQNRVSIGGSAYSGAVPRDATLLRVVRASYDPAKSASGLQVDRLVLSGGAVVRRNVRLTLDAPSLQWATVDQRALGQRTTHAIASGTIAGPGAGPFKLYSASLQLDRRESPLVTYAANDPLTLDALQLSRDSVRRLMSTLESLGITGGATVLPQKRTSTRGSAIARLDFTKNAISVASREPSGSTSFGGGSGPGHILYVVGSASWFDAQALDGNSYALPLATTRSHSHELFGQIVNSFYPKDFIVNESRSALSALRSLDEPLTGLPAANILMTGVPDGPPFLTLQAGGSDASTRRTDGWAWESSNETRWTSVSGRHEMKLAFELTVESYRLRRGEGPGAYGFNSLDDFVASRPASFRRLLNATDASSRGVHGAVGVGDNYQPSRFLTAQYGLRAELHDLSIGVPGNAALDSAFGVRSGVIPRIVALSPMAGFHWIYGPRNAQGYPDGWHSLSGGIRDYRGLVSAQTVNQLARESGQRSAARELFCVGDNTPPPQWSVFASTPESLPRLCNGLDEAVDAPATVPVATLMAPNFTVGHSWRANLTWTTLLAQLWSVTFSTQGSINTNQTSLIDLNFDGAPRFALSEEGGRPVFVESRAIDAPTGVLSLQSARPVSAFGRVLERRSDLSSRSGSFTTSLWYRPFVSRFTSTFRLPLRVSYTVSDIRSESNGFGGTTAGDPRVVSTAPESFSRHALLLATLLAMPDWGSLSLGLQLRSGARYTPRVTGDINGDGLFNDRAFIFDPRATSDTALASGMTRVLDEAPRAAASCLRDQLGRIAQSGSCVGPWSASLNASALLNPARLGFPNRGSVQIQVFNLLGGIDQLLHGSARLHGWGQPLYPDATLLTVRGFDASRQRFIYAVNPQFGSTSSRSGIINPVRVSIDVRIDLGPDWERESIKRALAPEERGEKILDSAEIRHRLAPPSGQLFYYVLNDRVALALTDDQVTAVMRLGDRYETIRDSIYGALAGYLAAQRGDYTRRDVQRRWHDALSDLARAQWAIGPPLRALLTAEQGDKVFSRGGPLSTTPLVMDERELERSLVRWQNRSF